MALRKNAPNVEVYVAGNLRQDVQCVSVSFGAGARGLGVADLVVQPPLRGRGRRRMLATSLANFGQPEIEVRIANRTVHWGKVLSQPGEIGDSGDDLRLQSRMDEHHFGNPLFASSLHYLPKQGNFFNIDIPPVFNPDYDGKNVPNMHNKQKNGGYVFLHHQTQETATAIKYQGGKLARFWTLPEAVHYLMNYCNGGQKYIKNPSLEELRKSMAGYQVFRNYEPPVGAFLPEQLDRILEPYGFSWTVDYIGRTRKIRVFRRGFGVPSVLKLQQPGAKLNIAASNLESCNITGDVGNRTFNAVKVYGDYEQYESTFELIRAWKPEFDDTPVDELSKHDENWFANAAKQRAWRDWTLNEAGDYIGLRNAIRKPYDLGQIFNRFVNAFIGIYVARRRRFLPCLSLMPDGSPQGHAGGVYIEYWENTEGVWLPIDNISPEGRQVRILERECGIRFDGVEVPYEIYEQGPYAKVRVTATVESDKRIGFEFNQSAASRLNDLRYEIVDAGSKFRYRKRHNTSRFAGVVTETAEVDDTQAIRQYAQQLLQAWNAATIEGTATLAGVNFNVAKTIGTTIAGIDGRAVDFSVGPATPRFPTVVGVKLDIQGQQTVISLDTFRGEGTGL